MFMRFLRLKVREEWLGELQRYYTERVVPALAGTPGCLYVSLLQPSVPGGECLSVTLWRSREDAEAYDRQGTFRELLAGSLKYLAAAGVPPPPGDPTKTAQLETYDVMESEGGPGEGASASLHVRIVNLDIRDGKGGELAEIYRKEISPAVLAAPGCLGAFLVEGAGRPNRALSITLWRRDEDAVRYEIGGTFDKLTTRLQDVLSGYYLWKHSFSAQAEGTPLTGGDLRVDRYSLVVGQTFPDGEE